MSVYSQIQRVVIATLTVIKNSQRAKANSKTERIWSTCECPYDENALPSLQIDK